MGRNYYDSDHLRQFPKVTELNEKLGNKFFDYYNSVFEGDELTAREKSLIALAVAHAVQCPYCIDAYTEASMQQGVSDGGMMEAVHVACAIRGGASLVHGVQMMNQAKKAGL